MDQIVVRNMGGGKVYVEFAGKSTEQKPVSENFVSGSMLQEVDTAILYSYIREDQTWYPQIALGGGE